VFTVVLLVVAAPLKLLGLQKELPVQLAELLQAGAALPMAAVGALILARRPGNRVGGLLLAVALGLSISTLAASYASYAMAHPGTSGAVMVAWAGTLIEPPTTAAIFLLGLLYPTSRLPSPRWRPVAQAVVVWTAAYMAFTAVLPDVKIGNVVIASNPLPLSTAVEELVRRVGGVWFAAELVVHFVLLLAVVASLVLRFRRARGVERPARRAHRLAWQPHMAPSMKLTWWCWAWLVMLRPPGGANRAAGPGGFAFTAVLPPDLGTAAGVPWGWARWGGSWDSARVPAGT